MRSLLEITDLTISEIEELMRLGVDIIDNPSHYSEVLKGKKLATLFYEPSTRTRLSFTSAMMELGGNVLGFSDAAASSVSKGENVADTVRVIECFADIIAMRHYKEGAPWVAAEMVSIPVINAGDGGHSHPTQTLTDLMTIYREKGGFDNLTIGFCGDLLFGRTVHSLTKAMGRYDNVKFVFISPDELKIPNYLRKHIEEHKYQYKEYKSIEEAMPELDILYMTRVQKERFDDEKEYERLKDSFVLDAEKMKLAKEDMIVLHPLPRVNEIAQEVDADHRALYFKQVFNGKIVRMALIYTLLKWAKEGKTDKPKPKVERREIKCKNLRCITNSEDVVFKTKTSDNVERCFYCDTICHTDTDKKI